MGKYLGVELLGLVGSMCVILLEGRTVLLNRVVRAGFTYQVMFQQRPDGGKGTVCGEESSRQRELGDRVSAEQHGGQCGKIRVSEQERPAWEVRSVCDRAGCCPALRSG